MTTFEEFANELANQFPQYAIDAAKTAMTEMADYLLGQVPEYPEETLGQLNPPDGVSFLRTDKQRKWFFAAVQAGELPGWTWIDAKYSTYYEKNPKNSGARQYPDIVKKRLIESGHPQKIGGARTGNLGRSQGRDITSDSNSVTALLGFDKSIASYAPWVVGNDYPGDEINGEMMYQARVHVDRWWQFQSIIIENLDDGWRIFQNKFWEEFSKKISEEKG